MLFRRVRIFASLTAVALLAACAGGASSIMGGPVAPGAPATLAPVTPTTTPATPVGLTPTATPTPPGSTTTASTKIGHVFIVVLENESESSTYGSSSPATYLNGTVKPAGAFIPNYYSTGHVSNDNYISMISGQGPNEDTSSDCQFYTDFEETTTFTDGQALGVGCVFPTSVPNITDQLKTAGLTWKSYDEDMGNDPTRESATCGHPTLNSQDKTQSAEDPSAANDEKGDQYATRHNPFMYFHSIIDDTTYCGQHVVNSTQFATDLASVATTPQYVFYTPNLCDDGHDSPCVTGQSAGGLQDIDAFMRLFIPIVTNSPAFKQDGLLIIVTDESATSDTTSCCGEIGTPVDEVPGLTGVGGGNSGALLVSPFITPGTESKTEYNHYSMLRSVEDIFGLAHIGFAQTTGLTSFGNDVFTSANHPTNAYLKVIERGHA